jgi:hypothetical protein
MDYVERTQHGHVFVGSDVDIFRMLSLASALRMYAETNGRIQASRFHTPKNMFAAATQFTGIKYKRGEYLKAAQDLTDDADRLKRLPRAD